jgi:hypothetical protein
MDPLLGLLRLLILLLLAHIRVILRFLRDIDTPLGGGTCGDSVDPFL